MPVWLRQFHIKKINEYNRKQEEEAKKQKGQSGLDQNSKIQRPNINPSSTYNFSK